VRYVEAALDGRIVAPFLFSIADDWTAGMSRRKSIVAALLMAPVCPVPRHRTIRKELMVRSNVTKVVVGLLAVLALGAFSAVPAFASGKPLVETKAATKVGANEATLNAVVNPNGASTKYHFEYWKTASEKLKTSEVSAGSGTSNVEASDAVTGLKAEKLYFYRIIATNSNGTTEGAIEEFWTIPTTGLPEFSKEALEKPANKFTATGSGPGFREVTGTNYGCDSSSAEGKFLTAKTASIEFKFKGCGADGSSCTTPGDESGEITTGSLPAQLVYLSKEKHEAALVVNYHETDYATWDCPDVTEAGIHGSIIVPITPVNTKTASLTLAFEGEEGKQKPRSFEGFEEKMSASPTLSLLGGPFDEGSVESSMKITDVEKIEVKA
jgi:hypothetical protein